MRRFNLSMTMGSMAILAVLSAAPAQAQDPLDALGAAAGVAAGVAEAPFVWGGRNYCWYPGGWHGPGWYWCGYAYRRGYGWGGGEGWHGWHHGGRGRHRGHPHGGHDYH